MGRHNQQTMRGGGGRNQRGRQGGRNPNPKPVGRPPNQQNQKTEIDNMLNKLAEEGKLSNSDRLEYEKELVDAEKANASLKMAKYAEIKTKIRENMLKAQNQDKLGKALFVVFSELESGFQTMTFEQQNFEVIKYIIEKRKTGDIKKDQVVEQYRTELIASVNKKSLLLYYFNDENINNYRRTEAGFDTENGKQVLSMVLDYIIQNFDKPDMSINYRNNSIIHIEPLKSLDQTDAFQTLVFITEYIRKEVLENLKEVDQMINSVNTFIDGSFPVDNFQYRQFLYSLISYLLISYIYAGGAFNLDLDTLKRSFESLNMSFRNLLKTENFHLFAIQYLQLLGFKLNNDYHYIKHSTVYSYKPDTEGVFGDKKKMVADIKTVLHMYFYQKSKSGDGLRLSQSNGMVNQQSFSPKDNMEQHSDFTKRFIGYTNQALKKNGLADVSLEDMKFLLIQGSHLQMPKEFGLDKQVLSGALLGKMGQEFDLDSKNKIIEDLQSRFRFQLESAIISTIQDNNKTVLDSIVGFSGMIESKPQQIKIIKLINGNAKTTIQTGNWYQTYIERLSQTTQRVEVLYLYRIVNVPKSGSFKTEEGVSSGTDAMEFII